MYNSYLENEKNKMVDMINININYIRKFFVIEMLMLMTMTVEVEVVNAVQVYKNGLKSKYKII